MKFGKYLQASPCPLGRRPADAVHHRLKQESPSTEGGEKAMGLPRGSIVVPFWGLGIL